jgi:RimJ/RimL family protein N-acetyltransferase
VESGKAPVIETARLRLRGHRIEDFEDSLALWRDAQVVRYIGGRPFSAEEVWARLLRYVGHWTLLGFGFWLIEEKDSGRFVGEAGFADYKRDIETAPKDTPEIGWALAPRAHGKGFATEAVGAVVTWGDRQLPAKQSWCMIQPENQASIRVALKCGYREIARATYKEQPQILFRREGRGAR